MKSFSAVPPAQTNSLRYAQKRQAGMPVSLNTASPHRQEPCGATYRALESTSSYSWKRCLSSPTNCWESLYWILHSLTDPS